MYINFDNYAPEIRKENRYLRQALGSEEGHARYQWAWAADLMMPMVIMDDQNRVIYDYYCACGRNVSIHEASCKFTAPAPKWAMRNLAFGLLNKWVFVKWSPPEADREDWHACYGSLPYPEGGYYVPVSAKQHCIAVDEYPFRQSSERIVQEIRKHSRKTAKQHCQDIVDKWNRLDAERKRNLKMRFIDLFPVHEGFPGKKENWSAGGTGESPVLKNFASKGGV